MQTVIAVIAIKTKLIVPDLGMLAGWTLITGSENMDGMLLRFFNISGVDGRLRGALARILEERASCVGDDGKLNGSLLVVCSGDDGWV